MKSFFSWARWLAGVPVLGALACRRSLSGRAGLPAVPENAYIAKPQSLAVFVDIWKFGASEVWSFGSLVRGSLDACNSERSWSFGSWMFGRLNLWLSGCVDVLTFGYMARAEHARPRWLGGKESA